MLLTAAALFLASSAAPGASGCAAAAPPVGADKDASFGQAVDGRTLKSLKDVARLRARSGDRLLVVRGGDFSGNRVGKLRLSNICFVESKLARSDWRGAEAPGLGFIRSDLSGAQLAGARLPGVLLRESNLSDVDASRAVLDGGRLDGGWGGSLARLKLDGARMTRFQVVCGTREEDGCPFERAGMSIRGSDFSGANLATFSFWDTVLDGAILDNTHVGMHQIGQLGALEVRGPIIVHSPRRYATLQPAEYLAVREGVRPIVRVTAQAENAAVDPATCAALPDRKARAICQGGPPLQVAALNADRRARTRAEADSYAEGQALCVSLSDDLVARCLARLYRSEAARTTPAVAGGRGERLTRATIFAALPVRFAEGFDRSPIYLRVLPLFLDTAPAQLTALPQADGSLRLRGASQGGCRIDASLRFNPASGWYGETRTIKQRGSVRRKGQWTPVVRFAGGTAEFAARPSSAVTCPEGTSLEPLQQVKAPAELIDMLVEGEAA